MAEGDVEAEGGHADSGQDSGKGGGDVKVVPTSGQATEIREGVFVEVSGLTSEAGRKLNGSRGAVRRFDEGKGRFEVSLTAGKLTSLKPDNLLLLAEEDRLSSLQEELLSMLASQPVAGHIAELRAEALSRADFDERLEVLLVRTRDPVYERHGVSMAWHLQHARDLWQNEEIVRRERRLAELLEFGTLGPAQLERGEACEVHGLMSEAGRAMNGSVGFIESWDPASARYTLALANGGATKALKPDNLRRIPASSFASPDEALAFVRALREAHRTPEALRELRELSEPRGDDSAGEVSRLEVASLRNAVLRIQEPALKLCGFRGDMAGQRHARAALQKFEADPSVCKSFASSLGAGDLTPQQGAPTSVVFLDIDGVLHSLRGDDVFRESCCSLLSYLIQSSSAAIVLSSTWRVEPAKVVMIDDMLRKRGLPSVHDATRDTGAHREEEICEWLDSHPEVRSWIAIDDMDLQCRKTEASRRMAGHFVRTDQRIGLTPEAAELAVGLLAAQRQLASALSTAAHFADSGAETAHKVVAALRWDPGDGSGLRQTTEAEVDMLVALCEACKERKEADQDGGDAVAVRSFPELAAPCGVGAALVRALEAVKFGSVKAFAELAAPAELEEKVLSTWYDPGDFGGERSKTPDEKRSLEKLYEACRSELGMSPGPYAGGARTKPPSQKTLRERADTLGVPAALRHAFVEFMSL